jgi:hypothetical protein
MGRLFVSFMKKIFVLLLSTACLFSAAQEDSTAPSLQLKLSVNYNSHLNYYGRTDNLQSSGVFPLAELWLKGFYANAAPVFINNKEVSLEYAGLISTVGYQSVSENWISNFYVSKPFYKASSQLLQSALKAQGGFSITKLSNIANISLGAEANWSDQMDFAASAGLDHIIRIENSGGSVWLFDPSIFVYAGTQNLSQTYQRKKSGLPFITPSEPHTEKYQKFNVLAYEASMPIIYAVDKWMVIATPAYVLPQNLVQVADRPDLSEKGNSMFYLNVALKYSF